LKDIGKVSVFDARPPFTMLKTIETGPITNHVNFDARREQAPAPLSCDCAWH
jgi:hypothetical protein